MIEAQRKGQWARGEWISSLMAVITSASVANFQRAEEAEENGRSAVIYTFRIAQEDSQWQLLFGGQKLLPAFRGRLWIEAETGRVMRLEQEALSIPFDYPINKVELTIDYDDIVIDGKRYWLPVRSQNLGCQRGSDNCSRNDVEFRNYRKFSAASSVFHTESTVDFGGGTQGSEVEPPVISEPAEPEKTPEP